MLQKVRGRIGLKRAPLRALGNQCYNSPPTGSVCPTSVRDAANSISITISSFPRIRERFGWLTISGVEPSDLGPKLWLYCAHRSNRYSISSF
ncbi:hypothetical protein J3E68DRAFT_418825 [Trichoderma sp. SZMC 28012]